MRRTERVIFAFAALGEPAQPVLLAQGTHAVAATRQDLVRVTLMPDVPDHLVPRRVEHGVDADSQLDHTQRRAEMPARLGNGVDYVLTQLVRERAQFGIAQVLEVLRAGNTVQCRGFGHGARPIIWSPCRLARDMSWAKKASCLRIQARRQVPVANRKGTGVQGTPRPDQGSRWSVPGVTRRRDRRVSWCGARGPIRRPGRRW